MLLDSVALRAVVVEAAPLLEGGLLQKISQLTEHDLALSFRRPGVTRRLLIRLAPEDARLGLVQGGLPPAREPSAFTMLLRKHLLGRPLLGLRQPGLERAAHLEFEGWTLVVEIPGRSNNLLLVGDQGRVAGMLVAEREGTRRLRPGQPYAPLARPERPDALALEGNRLPDLLAGNLGQPAAACLSAAVFGLPPHQARHLCRQAGLDPASPLSPAGLASLAEGWDPWRQRLLHGPYAPVLLPGGKVSPWPLGEPGEQSRPTMQEALETDSGVPGVRDARVELEKLVQKAQKKAQTLLQRRLGDLERARGADSRRLAGELLLAHSRAVPAGADRVTLPDWEGNPVEIALEPRASAVDNAQRLFREYRRLQRAQLALEDPIARVRAEIDFLDEVLLALKTATTAQEVEEVRQLWREERPGAGNRAKRRMQAPSPGPRRFSHDGFTLLVGRNPRQNEKLTLKVAARDDLWFHARNIPGSHVILRTAGRIPGEATLQAAAVLAARFSKAAASTAVEVVCTPVHRVRKPPGTPPGKVLYRGERTILVDPAARVEGLGAEEEDR